MEKNRTMDYEKKYKEALERARNIRFSDPNSATANVVCEEIFPELKESEDERIRKQLLNWFKDCHWDSIDNGTLKRDDIIAWLEKQGEPQPYRGNADTMRKNLIKAFNSVGSKHWGGFDVRDIIHFLESKDAIELEKQGEQNNIVQRLTAFAQHLNKRGAFRDDLCMDFEHEAQSFIEFREYQNNKKL